MFLHHDLLMEEDLAKLPHLGYVGRRAELVIQKNSM